MTFGGEVKGQRVYATIPRNSASGVTFPNSSTDANLTNSTEVKAASLVFSDPPAWNQMIFASNIISNTPIYVKCTYSGSLLGGGLTLEAYKGSAAGSNGNIAASSTTSTVTDASSDTYLTIKPTETYNAVRATVTPPLIAGTNTANVFYAFYIVAPTVTGTPSGPICSGTQINLGISSPNSLLQYNWYASDGTFISTGNTFSPSPTSTTTATVTYYVEAQEIGASFYSARVPIVVTVNPISILSSSLTPPAVCSSNPFNYVPSSSTSGTTFTWTRAAVSGISNPANSGTGGIIETLTNTTTLPINVIYKYTLATATCSKTQDVTVTVNPTPTLASIANQSICLGQSIDLTTLNPAITNGVSGTYSWFGAPGGVTPLTSTLLTPTVGTKTYYVRYITSSGCYTEKTVDITVNDLPTLTVTTPAVTIPEATSSLLLKATTNATNITWYTPSGSLAGTGASISITPPATVGTYIYTVIVDNGPGTCSNTANATISVYSTTVCPPLTQRVYADDASATSGSVTDAGFAADSDPKTGSTMSSPLSLLGLGAATQNLSWNTPVAAGTPVTIKFGPGVNLLGLGSGISVIPFKKNGSGGITTIGNTLSMNAALLTLLPGTNMLEYTFVPSNASGIPQVYDGVKVTLNALLSLGLSANIYEAYYYKTTPTLDCTKDVLDVLSGAEAPLGIGAATATVNVTNPWGVVDNTGTPTVLTNTIGVGAYAKERIIFSSQSLPGDSLKIITSVTGTILNLGLLGGFSIQRYLGNSPVGDLIAGNGSLLTLKLLDGGTKAALILAPMAEPYDAIEIRLGNVLSVFNSLNLHQIQRIANTRAIGADINNYIEVCQGTNVVLPTTACTTFEWYDQPTGGNLVNTGQTLNTTGLTNTKTYYIQPVRYGCKNIPRGILTVKINALPSPGTITGNSSVCIGQTLSLSNSTAPGGTWASVDESKATIDATGTVTGVAIGTTSITYTVTNGTTGCSSTITKSVTVNAIPTVSGITGNSALCVGNTIQLFNATPGGTWASSNTANATISSNGVVTALANGPTTITYTITSSGCSNAAFKIITVYPQPTASISGNSFVCQNKPAPNVTFTGTGGTAPYTFTYNINGGSSQSITTISGNSINLPVPTGTTGTFAYNLLSVTDASASQCTQTQTGTATIVINPLPTITLGSDPLVCEGIATTLLPYSATVSTPTDYTISWNPAAHLAGFQDIPYTALPPASITIPVPTTATSSTYSGTITVKNASGCVSSSTIFNVVVHTKLSTPHINITSN